MKLLSALALILALAPSVQADLVLLPDNPRGGQSLFRVEGMGGSWYKTHDIIPFEGLQGSALLDGDTLHLQGFQFTRPAHSYNLTWQSVQVQIWVDEQTFSLPDVSSAVVTNANATLITEGFDRAAWVPSGEMTGRWQLTGFEGTVVADTFTASGFRPGAGGSGFGTFGRDWFVSSRDGNPVIGEATGMAGSIGADFGVTKTLYEGVLDGVDFKLEFTGQTNHIPLMSEVAATVPEPAYSGILAFAMAITSLRRRT